MLDDGFEIILYADSTALLFNWNVKLYKTIV